MKLLLYLDLGDHVRVPQKTLYFLKQFRVSLWQEQWPRILNLLAPIVSLTLGRLQFSSWLFICCCQCILSRSQHSGVASIDTFPQLLW